MEKDYLMLYTTVGLGTTIWSPLASGLLSGKYNNGIPENSRFALQGFDWLKETWMVADKMKKVDQLKSVAEKLNTSLATLSIAWCIRNPNVTTAILGATKKEQLLENLKAIDLKAELTSEIIETIEQLIQTKPKFSEF